MAKRSEHMSRHGLDRRKLIVGGVALGAAAVAGTLARESVAQATGGGVKFSIDATNVKVEGGKVVFEDPNVATMMARYGESVRRELGQKKEKVAISPSQITVDDRGRVVIANAEYARKVQESLKGFRAAAKDTNYCCNCNAYQCGK